MEEHHSDSLLVVSLHEAEPSSVVSEIETKPHNQELPSHWTPQHKVCCEMVDGVMSGRDPRKMTREELEQAGHRKQSYLAVIREKCRWCTVWQDAEIRYCTHPECALWPYRMRKNPFLKRATSPEKMKRLQEAKAARAQKTLH